MQNLGSTFTQHMEFYSLNLFQMIFSVAKSTLAVLIISFPLAALGNHIARLLAYKVMPAFSVSVAYGLSFVVFLAYYANLVHASLIVIFTLVILFGFSLISYELCHNFYNNRSPKHTFILTWFSPKKDGLSIVLMSVVFFSFNLLTLKSSEVAPGVVGNNDVYFWAASADQLLGRFNFGNILPLGEAIWHSNLKADSNGTYLAIALTSVQLGRSAFEVTPLFMGAVITWTGMVVAELVLFIFSVRRSTSLIVAIIVVYGSFFHYITYNYFAGQILATFIFLTLLHVSLVLYSDDAKQSLLSVAVKLFPLLALLLIAYQSGFMMFFCALLLYVSIISSNKSVTRVEAVSHVKKVLISMSLGLLFAFLCYPLVIGYLYRMTTYVSSVKGGWKLPFLGGFYLFNLPIPIPLSGRSLLLSNTALSMGSLLVAVTTMFFLIRKITRLRDHYKLQNARVVWLSGIVFLIALTGYVLAYSIKGDAYQVWKLAAFTVMPISFIPISVLTIWLFGVFSLVEKSRDGRSYAIGDWRATDQFALSVARPIMLGGALISVVICLIGFSYFSSGVSDLGVFNNLKNISGQLKGAKTIILDLPPYRETLIAFNVFSRDYTLIPLGESYLPKADIKAANFSPETKWITTGRCNRILRGGAQGLNLGKESDDGQDNRYAVFENPVTTGGSIIGAYTFEKGGGACLLGNSLTIASGLSGAEPFGRWSDGKEVELYFQVPDPLRGRELMLRFGISPFLVAGVHAQVVTPYLDGKKTQDTVLSKPGVLSIRLRKDDTNKARVNLTFKISDPVRPSDLNIESLDTRLLGVAFENMIIEMVQ